MHKAFYSSVSSCNTDRIWTLIRDFNNYPAYISGVTDSVIEDGKAGDETGAVRRFCYGDHWLRQRLTAHSDENRSFSYAGLEPFHWPVQDSGDAPAPIAYSGTLQLTPIIDGDRTFIEWSVEFNCSERDAVQWNGLLTNLISQWVDSLKHSVEGQPSVAVAT